MTAMSGVEKILMNGKVILVTGAFGQLGMASTKLLLERGATVVANDIIDPEARPDVKELLERYGEDKLYYARIDVNTEDNVKKLAETIDGKFGRLDGYMHTTYSSSRGLIIEMDLEVWEKDLHGCMTSTFLIAKHMLPLMIKSGGGSVVNVSSIMSEVASERACSYSAAKAGVNQFTQVMAVEYAPHNIRANSLLPAYFMAKDRLEKAGPDMLQVFKDGCLLERSATAEEVAEMGVFLLSDAASYITGSIVHVDGGYQKKLSGE